MLIIIIIIITISIKITNNNIYLERAKSQKANKVQDSLMNIKVKNFIKIKIIQNKITKNLKIFMVNLLEAITGDLYKALFINGFEKLLYFVL